MELLIRVSNKPYSTPRERAQRMQRGDIVSAMPDGHVWSLRERKNRAWRILAIPSMTQVEVDALLSPENDPQGIKSFTWKRKRRLNIDSQSLPKRITDYLNDNTRDKIKLLITEAGETALIRSIEEIKPDATTL